MAQRSPGVRAGWWMCALVETRALRIRRDCARVLSSRPWRPLAALSVGAAMALIVSVQAAPSLASPAEERFLAENRHAMERMMAGMAVSPSGDVDHDFSSMMIPHHQGAIDMARAELRYGHNEQLRRIAQEIIVDQQQEIVAMRLVLAQQLPPALPAPDQPTEVSFPASKTNQGSQEER
jgi:hypothetical protein